MPIRLPKIPGSQITPREVFMDRRRFMQGATAVAAGLGGLATGEAVAEQVSAKLDAPRNSAFVVKDELTPKKLATTYNNFYEFGTGKGDPAENAGPLKVRPWTCLLYTSPSPRD